MASRDQRTAKDGARLRLYLCDDTESFRALMREVLPDPAIEVVGESADGVSVVQGVLDTEADVVLLDLAMPRIDGMSAIEALCLAAPDCAIVVFSGFASEAMAERCRALGAHAYVEKGTPVAEVRAVLFDAVRSARATSGPPGTPPATTTARESSPGRPSRAR